MCAPSQPPPIHPDFLSDNAGAPQYAKMGPRRHASGPSDKHSPAPVRVRSSESLRMRRIAQPPTGRAPTRRSVPKRQHRTQRARASTEHPTPTTLLSDGHPGPQHPSLTFRRNHARQPYYRPTGTASPPWSQQRPFVTHRRTAIPGDMGQPVTRSARSTRTHKSRIQPNLAVGRNVEPEQVATSNPNDISSLQKAT